MCFPLPPKRPSPTASRGRVKSNACSALPGQAKFTFKLGLARSGVRTAMLQGWVVIAVALAYIGLLFLVASYGDRSRGLGRERPHPAADLSAVAGDLLHLLDLLRLGRLGLAHRLRLPHHLYRPDADGRAVLAAAGAHRAARQGAEHHLDRRLHRRALRQAPGRRRDGRADRHRRHHPLHRLAAQSGFVLARHHPRRTSRRPATSRSRCSATSRCSSRCRWRPSRCCSAPAISTRPNIRTA